MTWTLLITIVPVIHQTLARAVMGKDREDVSNTDGKTIYYTGIIVLVITGLVVFAAMEAKVDIAFWTLLMISVMLYQALMERLYLPDPRYYIVTLLTLAATLVYVLFFVL
ncbi:hypothetical protein [Salibacterium qingdaonense]|uniref:DUF4181 domain-containing protein n=1 Tax=Salibacterium qingdaonense TaxID=266892 RepID=A0A1I4LKJ6_9BACI|nr:hypothetical protein [Salibacterium qingdaonense]SFL91323.1 hypothetical protein SAMN04488054_10820 [Salibacterium qingdaonense]